MSRIYFVRHGEGMDNVERKFSCKKADRPLTERGRLQARETGEYLARKAVDAIYCSTMNRAQETAKIMSACLGMEPYVLEEFREVNIGDLDGTDFSPEGWKVYHQVVGGWFAGNKQVSFPGGEDYDNAWKRTHRGLERMLAGKTGQTLVLVGHSGIFTATIRELCPDLDAGWLQNTEYYNCAITELEIESAGGRLQGRLVDWANYSHLSEAALSRMPGIPPADA